MKTTVTFSIESATISNFATVCDEKKLSKNRELEGLISVWLEKNEKTEADYTSVPEITCNKCKAKYADIPKFADGCPRCKAIKTEAKEEQKEATNNLEIELERAEQKLKRYAKMQKKEGMVTDNEIETLKERIKTIKKEIKDAESILEAKPTK